MIWTISWTNLGCQNLVGATQLPNLVRFLEFNFAIIRPPALSIGDSSGQLLVDRMPQKALLEKNACI
jgi:hypothetical protein